MTKDDETHKGSLLIAIDSKGRIEIKARVSGVLFKEDNMWISYCPDLELSTCGKTRKQALERTKEAVELFFDSCLKRGTLEQALQELNWERECHIDLDGVREHGILPWVPPHTTPAFMIKARKDNWSGYVDLS